MYYFSLFAFVLYPPSYLIGDGNGFGYFQYLATHGYAGYALLLLVYVIGSAILLLNGLIGIFGDAFTATDERNKNDTVVVRNLATLIEDMKVAEVMWEDRIGKILGIQTGIKNDVQFIKRYFDTIRKH